MSGRITDHRIMDAINDLIRIGRLYAAHVGIESTTLSWRLFRDSKKFDALLSGSDIQVRRHAAAMAWLSANWPESLDWPDDVRRPVCEREGQGEGSEVVGSTMAPDADLGAGKTDENVSRTAAAA